MRPRSAHVSARARRLSVPSEGLELTKLEDRGSAMKVALSVPAPVFEAAEKAARRLRMSRSRLYAKGPAGMGPAWEAASLEVLRREKW